MTYITFSLVVVIIGFLLWKAYRNTQDIKINTIAINSTNNTTAKQPALSILHLSDLHLENISITPEQLEKKLTNKKIDIIALTGDFLDRKRTIPKLIPYLEVLQRINAVHGIYAVLGNHDYVLKEPNLTTLKEVLTQHDCHVLQNANKSIHIDGQVINIVGIDDYSTNRSNIAKSYENIKEGMNIVLTHDPNVVLEMEDFRFDYLMAGHFHGGQICYPKAYHLAKMGTLARNNIIKGLHMHNNAPYYISEGLGQTGVNIRVGSRPEITFHNLPITTHFKSNVS
ncbi:metallophosphoesterase [Oceanobacillus halotolerans]|uniref:metallophosphoesterase n=1 Tax=Oceanobacillus halotolerans TaxID=2663380 RepID=UPI0013DD141D|nr:metallophosphoesterase [Oceanobacillus halotolerans]